MKNDLPLRPVDDDMRALARRLLTTARFAALAVVLPETGTPFVSRIAVGLEAGGLVALISQLARHTGALRASPTCSLLVGEPGAKGDPLSHPRLTLQCTARFVGRDAPDFAALRAEWLAQRPKAKLYVDFADFSFVRFAPYEGFLNGGFGLAAQLAPADLAIDPPGAGA